jgi:hypothetical protein
VQRVCSLAMGEPGCCQAHMPLQDLRGTNWDGRRGVVPLLEKLRQDCQQLAEWCAAGGVRTVLGGDDLL